MKRWIGRAIPAALALTAALWFGNRTVGVTRYTLPSARLPQSFAGFRIALLTDLHGRQFGSGGRTLARCVCAQKPDLIVLGGDLADEWTDIETLRPLLSALSAAAPVCYVTGNHEWRMKDRKALMAMLDEYGVTRLPGTFETLERGDGRIVLAGVDDPNGPAEQTTAEELMAAVREQYPHEYVLALYHRNDRLEQWAALGADTVLSGHAHGGIVRLPFLGPVFGTHYELFPSDAQGVYRSGDTALVVSRGLGPSRRLPLRIFNRPELVVVILQPEA